MAMAAVRTSLVKRRHAYTSVDIPWSMDVDRSMQVTAPDGRRFGWQLFHYLAGGGMRAFGRSSGRELLDRRQSRFLWIVSGLAVLWVIFRFV